MSRIQVAVTLLLILIAILAAEPSTVHATSTLIQQNNNGVSSSSNPIVVAVSFPGAVTSGNVVAVGLADFTSAMGLFPLLSLADSLGSSFTQAATIGNDVAIY